MPPRLAQDAAEVVEGGTRKAIPGGVEGDFTLDLLDDRHGACVRALAAGEAILELVQVRAHLEVAPKVVESVEGLSVPEAPLVFKQGGRASLKDWPDGLRTGAAGGY